MKRKTYRVILLVLISVYSVYLFYSGYTVSEPVNVDGFIAQKKFWTISWLKFLALILMVIVFIATFLVKKNKEIDNS